MGLIKKGRIKEEGIVYLREKEFVYEKASASHFNSRTPDINITPGEDASSIQRKTMQQIEDAREEAQRIIDQAVEEAQRIKEEAKVSGIDEARREAEDGASDKVRDAIKTLNDAVKERKRIIKDAESEILRLSLKVAEQILRSEVSLHRDVCLNIVSEAISRVGDREQIIIKVNRDDLEHIKKYKSKISGLADGVKSLSIVEDSTVDPGGCVIETNLGYVDARISTKIKAIEEAFKKVE